MESDLDDSSSSSSSSSSEEQRAVARAGEANRGADSSSSSESESESDSSSEGDDSASSEELARLMVPVQRKNTAVRDSLLGSVRLFVDPPYALSRSLPFLYGYRS